MTGKRLLVGGPTPNFEETFLKTCLQSFIDNADQVLFESVLTKERYTCREIHQRVSGITHTLKSLGLEPGDIVLIVGKNNIETHVTQMGVWFSGASTATINPLLPIEELRSFLTICKSVVVFAAEEFVEKMQEAVEGLDYKLTIISPNGQSPVLNYYDCINSASELLSDVKYDKDHCLAIMFTSGTTGLPKGAIVSDRNLFFDANTFNRKGYYKEKILLTSPIYWISNNMMLVLGLITASSFVIIEKPTILQIFDIIKEYKPTDWFTGPSVLVDMSQVTENNKYDTSSIKRIIVGGAVVHVETKKLIASKVFKNRNVVKVTYGSTEAGIVCLDRTHDENDEPKDCGIGSIMEGVTLKVIDPNTGESLPAYTRGELCVKSPGVVRGYINKEVTEKEFDKDGYWHMGDIGYYDEQGNIFYTSRLVDVMKYRGQQIAPAEIESIILKHPGVIESAVVGKPSMEHGHLPTAFVVRKPNYNLTEQELFDFVSKDVIDEKKLRGGIFFVEELPKSAVGKVLRRDLVKMLSNFT